MQEIIYLVPLCKKYGFHLPKNYQLIFTSEYLYCIEINRSYDILIGEIAGAIPGLNFIAGFATRFIGGLISGSMERKSEKKSIENLKEVLEKGDINYILSTSNKNMKMLYSKIRKFRYRNSKWDKQHLKIWYEGKIYIFEVELEEKLEIIELMKQKATTAEISKLGMFS